VLVRTGDGAGELLIGDAAYTPRVYTTPELADKLPGQASDPVSFRESLGRIHQLAPARVHFCHHTDTIHT
jgi:hypothetical protein